MHHLVHLKRTGHQTMVRFLEATNVCELIIAYVEVSFIRQFHLT